jgi:hypothetical protein
MKTEEKEKDNTNNKSCHSFWHRECTNKGFECHRCIYYYSLEDWNKMTKKERNQIKGN